MSLIPSNKSAKVAFFNSKVAPWTTPPSAAWAGVTGLSLPFP